eukprot:TRINITY_DN78123_c0_g1_i2.p1 TRINITY_DN78123_c0_g1~~TRINITY_DN78123_c0_g1_i2.p1  ORF type:complete len:102 (+),score=15.68 TRINITY_DN78123_c0_g1_i2:80-385(+)
MGLPVTGVKESQGTDPTDGTPCNWSGVPGTLCVSVQMGLPVTGVKESQGPLLLCISTDGTPCNWSEGVPWTLCHSVQMGPPVTGVKESQGPSVFQYKWDPL